jgi:hypothetical protein
MPVYVATCSIILGKEAMPLANRNIVPEIAHGHYALCRLTRLSRNEMTAL